jgi:hypothetical protein
MGNRSNRLTAIQKKNQTSQIFPTWPFSPPASCAAYPGATLEPLGTYIDARPEARRRRDPTLELPWSDLPWSREAAGAAPSHPPRKPYGLPPFVFRFFRFLPTFPFSNQFFKSFNLSHPRETPTLEPNGGRKRPTLERNGRKGLPCTYPVPTYPGAAGHIRRSPAICTTFRRPPRGKAEERPYPGATLELPWSGRAYPGPAYPGATLYLP